MAKRKSARQREAKRRRQAVRIAPAAPRLCVICDKSLPPVPHERQVTCGTYRCQRERRRQMTRERVARFRSRRRDRAGTGDDDG